MKLKSIHLTLLFAFLFFANKLNAQNQTQKTDSVKISSDLTVYENTALTRPAKYKNGNSDAVQYILSHFEYTSETKNTKGLISLNVIIEKDGSVTHPKILKGLSKAVNTEILRVVNRMPKWKPAIHQSEYKRVSVTLSLNFE